MNKFFNDFLPEVLFLAFYIIFANLIMYYALQRLGAEDPFWYIGSYSVLAALIGHYFYWQGKKDEKNK